MATQPHTGFPGIRRSYTCAEQIAAPANTNAGVVVERRTGTDLVGVAADASIKVCGVAIDDVYSVARNITDKIVGSGHEMTVYSGGFVNVVASAIVTEGQRLCASASGQVRPWVAGTDAAASCFAVADQAAAAGAVVRIGLGVAGI